MKDRVPVRGVLVPAAACPKCRYDLSATPIRERVITCPECGRTFEPSDLIPKRRSLRGALISGVAPWSIVLILGFVFPMTLRWDEAGRLLWCCAVGASVLSVAPAAALTAHSWRHSFWFDRAVLVTIVVIANVFGLLFAYLVSEVLAGVGV
jgi:hypothetical protein